MAYAQVRDVGGGVIKQSYIAASSKAQALVADCDDCVLAGMPTPPNIELEMELVYACHGKTCCDDAPESHRIVDHGIFDHDGYYHWKMILDQGRMLCSNGPPFWHDDPHYVAACSWSGYQLGDYGRWEIWSAEGCAGALDYYDFKAIVTRVQINNYIVGPPARLQAIINIELWGERQSDGYPRCEQIFLNTNLDWVVGTTCWQYGVWWPNVHDCDVPPDVPHWGEGRAKINEYPPP